MARFIAARGRMLVGLRVWDLVKTIKAMKTLEEGVVGVLSGKCACRCRG